MTQNIDLSSLTSAQGFKITGAASDDYSGYSVSGIGDINGNGCIDLIVGAYGAGSGGISYVIFGNATGFSDINLNDDLISTNRGFKVIGASSSNSGYSVSEAGDVNGDGYADIIIGARSVTYQDRYGSGAAYIIFGKATWSSNVDLSKSLVSNNQGFAVYGATTSDYIGEAVSTAGDINGDGYDDIIIGANDADPNGKSYAGAAYVILGKATGFSDVDLANDLTLTNQGFSISGAAASDRCGISVSSAGDVNNDNFDDIIIGASGVSSYTGAAYVILGKASGFTNINLVNDLSAANLGFTLYGAAGSSTGDSVSGAGDINNDGYDDMIVGAPNAYGTNTGSGITYIVLGKATNSNINLSSLSTSQGLRIIGVAYNDNSGSSVSKAGYVNNDNYADVIIGAPNASPSSKTSAGTSYVVFGTPSWSSNIIYLSSLSNNNQGFAIYGAATNDDSGFSVSNWGDINNDGYDDVLIGTPGANSKTGITYVILGSDDSTKTPSKAPTFAPSLAPTTPTSAPSVAPTKLPTSFPSIKPTIATSSPSESPTKAPTSSPTAEYLTVDISTGGEYIGTNDKEEFVVDSSEDTTITGGGGADIFTIMAHSGITTTVTDFNENNELIDLTSFTNIHSMDDFTITSGSAVINLDDGQKVILQNLSPSDLTADNFIFSPAPQSENNENESSGDINGIIIGAAIGGAALLIFAYCAYARVTHAWPFMNDDVKDSSLEFSGATGNPLGDA